MAEEQFLSICIIFGSILVLVQAAPSEAVSGDTRSLG